MLGELRIRNLGVIAEALVEFAPGLTALTGERIFIFYHGMAYFYTFITYIRMNTAYYFINFFNFFSTNRRAKAIKGL